MDKKNLQVVVFMTTWCPHCKNMKNHTWTNDSVRNAMVPYHNSKPAFILCDKPQNRYLVDEDHNILKKANNMSPDELVGFLDDLNE